MTKTRTLGNFVGDNETPTDLPELAAFPSVNNGERLLGMSSDRTVLYHRPSYELWEYDAEVYAATSEFSVTDRSNTAASIPEFSDFQDQLSNTDWIATTTYSDLFFGKHHPERYPATLPAPADRGDDSRATERLLGVDTRGIGHYEVVDVDIPYIRRYVPFGDSGIIRWNPSYYGYETPKRGLAQRRIAQYIVTTEIECHGWQTLSEYGQALTTALLDELDAVYKLVEASNPPLSNAEQCRHTS